jgi:type II secretion system protein G
MPKLSGFTLIELLIVIAIIGILTSIGLVSFNSSQMKSRDAKRKANLQQIASALELYYNDKNQYPVGDSEGRVMGCGAGATAVCTWGTTPFSNTTTGTIYMTKIPTDPSSYNYYYRASRVSGIYTKYQIYAHLENSQDKSIITTTLSCGTATCNYGISSGNTTP